MRQKYLYLHYRRFFNREHSNTVKGFLVNSKLNESYPKIILLLAIHIYSPNTSEIIKIKNRSITGPPR